MNEPDHPSQDFSLPPRPQPPDPDECCRSDCTPCVFELYEEALERWEKEVAAILERRRRHDAAHRQS